MMGLPTAVTDANGTVVTSSYDENYRVTETGIENIADISYTYSNGNLASIARTDDSDSTQTYSFTYDSFGNMLTLKVGNRTLATYTYNGQNGLLSQQTYGNGDTVSFTYDNLGRTKTVTFADNRVMTYTYNGEGRLHSVVETDGDSTVTYLYTYDSIGRLISSEQRNGDNSVLRTHQTYNASNQLTGQSWQLGNSAYSESYTYNSEDGSLNTMTSASGDTLTMVYDGLRRLSAVTGGPFNRSYTYRDISDTQTALQVSSFSYPNLGSGLSFGYTYDDLGNIATYTAPGDSAISYTYDIQGQLLKAEGDQTYTYTYDSVGNILTASDGTDTHTYAYGDANWKDLLTSYDGEAITYDNSGNPISYYNGTRWAFTWSNGRRLTRAVSTGTAVDFTYGLDGLRTSKTVDGVTHNYLYADGKLLRESDGTNTLDFVYDARGGPYALIHTVGTESPVTTTYYYITNLQGDVVQLVDSDDNTVASYEYDPYGKVISATGSLAEINPLRYRGYYYDAETGLYYLLSRYYDPTIGRFVNSDIFASTGLGIIGYDAFVYCGNSPISNRDSFGDRYVAATTIQGESASDRSIAFRYQNQLRNNEKKDVTVALTYGNYWSVTVGMYNFAQNTELAMDLKGNIQINSSFSFDVTSAGSLSASFGHSGSVFFVPDTSYLPGGTSYLGGSTSVPIAVIPIDLVGSVNVGQTTDGYWGILGSMGVAPPTVGGFEVHGGYSHTFAVTPQINVFTIFEKLF